VNTCRKTTEALRTTEFTDDTDEARKSALPISPRKSVPSVVLSVSVVKNGRTCHPTSVFGFNLERKMDGQEQTEEAENEGLGAKR
jgi:hypothetical protein